MKRAIILVVAILGATTTAWASCGFPFPTCSLDGATMTLEQTYYNGMHKSEKWSHKTINGEYHYVIIQCN